MFQPSRRPLTCLLACSSALMLSSALLGACSGAEADGDPEYGDIEGYGGPQNPGGNNSGANNTPGQPSAQNAAPGTGSNGSTTTNTPPSTTNNPPNTIPPNTPPNSEGNPTTPPLNTGTNTGTNAGTNNGTNNGGAMAPGAGGAGSGLPPDPGTGSNPTPPVVTPVPPVVTPTPPVVTPAGPDIPCPTGATFCSGFESDTLPAGADDQSQPPVPLEFDTTVKRTGNRSLKVVSAGGFNIRQVIAPIPGQAFWVRLFIQTSDIFGDNNHDSLFVASTASPSQDNNAESGPEFSEQGNQIVLNADDQLFSAVGAGFPQGTGPQLSANTWHCEEAFYDGGTGNVQIFSDGEEIINAPGYARRSYQTFRFGYIGFNTVRTVWFDDVVVASNRVGCN